MSPDRPWRRHAAVVVVGAGPTGLTTANLLGVAGIDTLLIERDAATVQQPRAVSIDDEALRTMQAAGLADHVIAEVALDYGARYLTPGGALFATVEPTTREFGYPRRSAFRQPILEATLRDGLDRFGHVETWFGHRLAEIAQDDNGVTLGIADDLDREMHVTCDYLVASDGAGSTARRLLDIDMEGSTYSQRWLIVDLEGTRDASRQTQVFCDPRRPAISLPGPDRTRRFEFMLFDGEDDETAESPEFTRRLLLAHGPDADADIVRRQAYTFHARIATRWSVGRVFLAGDAAHLSPPFAGQGMNSGIRDAHNIAWKLASVVKQELMPAVLDSYEQERKPHAWALIEMAITLGRVMMPPSMFRAWLTQTSLRLLRLVPPARAYVTQMKHKPTPYFAEGYLRRSNDPALARRIGRLFPQPWVEESKGHGQMLDALVGNRFAMVLLTADPLSGARRMQAMFADTPGIQRVCVSPWDVMPRTADATIGLRDRDGALSTIMKDCMDTVFLLRPDHYVAAAIRLTASAEEIAGVKELLPRVSPARARETG